MRPLIAILRGIGPDEAIAAADILAEEGFIRIEVPLNSPHPFVSIERMARALPAGVRVGAGTVSRTADVRSAADAGGELIVSPNTSPAVIRETKRLGMESWPGALTAAECMTALAAGADGLKLFPASSIGPAGGAALRTALPASTTLYAVGGADERNMSEWLAAGLDGFGIGSALYRPGLTPRQLRERAARIVTAFDRAVRCSTEPVSGIC